MFQKRLKKELNKIEVPAYDTHKYKETIAKAKKIKLHPENLRMSSTEFLQSVEIYKNRNMDFKNYCFCFSIISADYRAN